MIRCECPHCDARVKMKDEFAGRIVRCPKCRDTFQLPDADDEPAPARRRRLLRERRARVGCLEWMGPTVGRVLGGGALIVLGILVGTGGVWLGSGFGTVLGWGGVGGGVALVMIGCLIIRGGGWGD